MSKENNIRYLTANTPPADDNSNKVPTTEWVQEKLDDVEAAVSGGMFPKVSSAVAVSIGNNRYSFKAPSGGTWWVYKTVESDTISNNNYNKSYSGGAQITTGGAYSQTYMFLCIKIA